MSLISGAKSALGAIPSSVLSTSFLLWVAIWLAGAALFLIFVVVPWLTPEIPALAEHGQVEDVDSRAAASAIKAPPALPKLSASSAMLQQQVDIDRRIEVVHISTGSALVAIEEPADVDAARAAAPGSAGMTVVTFTDPKVPWRLAWGAWTSGLRGTPQFAAATFMHITLPGGIAPVSTAGLALSQSQRHGLSTADAHILAAPAHTRCDVAAESALKILHKLGISRCFVAAQGLSCNIVLRAAMLQPALFRGIIAVSAPHPGGAGVFTRAYLRLLSRCAGTAAHGLTRWALLREWLSPHGKSKQSAAPVQQYASRRYGEQLGCWLSAEAERSALSKADFLELQKRGLPVFFVMGTGGAGTTPCLRSGHTSFADTLANQALLDMSACTWYNVRHAGQLVCTECPTAFTSALNLWLAGLGVAIGSTLSTTASLPIRTPDPAAILGGLDE